MGKNQFVTPHPKGGWQVKGANNTRPTVRTATKKEALTRGREIARNQRSEMVVCGRNGRIQSKNSYGNDPFPPKG